MLDLVVMVRMGAVLVGERLTKMDSIYTRDADVDGAYTPHREGVEGSQPCVAEMMSWDGTEREACIADHAITSH